MPVKYKENQGWLSLRMLDHKTFNHVVAGSIPARLTNKIKELLLMLAG